MAKSLVSCFFDSRCRCTTKHFIYNLFQELTYRSDLSTDIHVWWPKWRRLTQGCTFWGFRWYCPPFWGWNPPTGVFKPNGQNIKSFILLKLLHRFQPNFAHRYRPQVVIVSGPNMRPTNPRWRTAAILKNPLYRHIAATVWPILINLAQQRTLTPFIISTVKI